MPKKRRSGLRQLGFDVKKWMSEARTVVVPVESVDERLDRRLVEVADVSRRLTRLLASHLWKIQEEAR